LSSSSSSAAARHDTDDLLFPFLLPLKQKNQIDDLSSLTSLLRLDLNDNPRLRSLEPVLSSTSGSLKHLVAARCTGLSLSSSSPSPPPPSLLPRGLLLPCLRVVDLTSCGLTSFDASPARKLAALILTGNRGVEVSGLSSCKELATLVVKNCDLTDEALSLAISGSTSIVKLSAAHNRLRGGDKLDLIALRGTLSELRLAHNDLRSIPKGLSPRLRVLDLGGNAKLGPLERVAGELARISSGGGDGIKSKNSSWLRAVTLRGTAAALERGYAAAVARAAPALRVLDDKRVTGRDAAANAAAEVGEVGGEGEQQKKEKYEKKKKKKEKEEKKEKKRRRRSSEEEGGGVAVGKLAGETGLGAPSLPPPPPLPLAEGQQQLPLPPPPPPPATPRREKSSVAPTAKVIEVASKKKKTAKGGDGEEKGKRSGVVATGKEAARFLSAAAAAAAAGGGGGGVLEELEGW